ncbi:ATP-binding protein [Micromonospora chalcea]
MEQLRVALPRSPVDGSPTPCTTRKQIQKGTHKRNWLPRTVPDFVGRKEIVDRLLHDVGERSGSGPTIRLIDGTAGCGKTTLALHVLAAGLLGHTEDTWMSLPQRLTSCFAEWVCRPAGYRWNCPVDWRCGDGKWPWDPRLWCSTTPRTTR